MKLEDNIKETLEKRTIKPSDASWNALANRLDAEDRKKNKTVFWWIGVAASLVAIAFTISVFFNTSTTDVQEPILVDSQEQIEQQQQPIEKLPQQQQLAEEQQKVENTEMIQKETPQNELAKKKTILKSPIKQDVLVAENENLKTLKPLETLPQKATLEDVKALEIVAQIENLKRKGQTVTDADIDALLQKAQKEITYQSIIKEGTRTVDANALLQDVETDLQQSFRNKVFDALKNSYETVKTAVAERNN